MLKRATLAERSEEAAAEARRAEEAAAAAAREAKRKREKQKQKATLKLSFNDDEEVRRGCFCGLLVYSTVAHMKRIAFGDTHAALVYPAPFLD